jgi:hypothetical protein
MFARGGVGNEKMSANVFLAKPRQKAETTLITYEIFFLFVGTNITLL